MQKVKIKDCIQLENSRGKFNKQEMADLMASLKQDGLLQSIGVRPKGKKFEIVYGNRRFLAAKKLGWSEIDAKVLDVTSEKDFLFINLIENIQRKDITVFEQGRLFNILKTKHDLSIPEIAVRVGLNKTKVKSALNIFMDTPKEFRDKVMWSTGSATIDRKGTIPVSVAEKINTYGRNAGLNHSQVKPIYQEVLNDKLNVNSVREVIDHISHGLTTKKAIELVDKVRYLRLSIPVYKKEVERWNKEWEGKLTDHFLELLYTHSDFSEPC